jgi:hypothetical protein
MITDLAGNHTLFVFFWFKAWSMYHGLLYSIPFLVYLSEIKVSFLLEGWGFGKFVRIVHFYMKVLTTIPTCLGMEESMHHEGRNSWAKVT